MQDIRWNHWNGMLLDATRNLYALPNVMSSSSSGRDARSKEAHVQIVTKTQCRNKENTHMLRGRSPLRTRSSALA